MSAVACRIEDDIAQLSLQRPARHNALVPELLEALRDALAECRAAQPAALILGAAGSSFSTGGDVRAFYATPRGQRRAYADRLVGLLNAVIVDLLRLPCPTIAAVHGAVTGGSVGLVLGCDIAVAGPGASFAPWYTAVGFSPDGGWSTLMPERIGRAHAIEIQLLNRTLDADEAWRLGLVQHRSAKQSAPDYARTLAQQIRCAQSGSIGCTLALTRPDIAAVERGLDMERRAFLDQIETEEADAGMAAFLGGR